jgi:hypothetical protein
LVRGRTANQAPGNSKHPKSLVIPSKARNLTKVYQKVVNSDMKRFLMNKNSSL